MDGSQVWTSFQAGGIDQIRAYCETDVMNTWLLYCRFQLIRGSFSQAHYNSEIALAREMLGARCEAHWHQYLAAWPTSDAC
jgi:predicted PolB exonuclease-like 3'-5' exonuclease